MARPRVTVNRLKHFLRWWCFSFGDKCAPKRRPPMAKITKVVIRARLGVCPAWTPPINAAKACIALMAIEGPMACFIGVLRMDVNTGIIMNPPPMPINPHKNPVNILIGINWNKGCSVVSEVSLGVLFSSSNKDDCK